MAAVIPEAAEAVTAGESAIAGAGETAAGGSKAAVSGQGGRSSRLAGGARKPAGGGLKGRTRTAATKRARAAGKGARRARVPGKGRTRYQPVILAEFLAAVLIIALVPVAKGGSDAAKAKGSPSPYSVGDIKQMAGVGGTYFVLALLSGSARYGRLTAWFGGLVLIGIGLAQTRGGGLVALFKIFGPAPAEAPPVAPGDFPSSASGLPPGAAAPGLGDATGLFPVIGPNPSTTQPGPLPGVTIGPPPGAAVPGTGTAVTITPPPGGSGTLTSEPIPPAV